MDEFYGKQIIIDGPVKFTGDPKDDPENDLAFQMWKTAINEVYQPERSKREDPVITVAKFTGDIMRQREDNVIRECGALNTTVMP